jgi:hypothetical protein
MSCFRSRAANQRTGSTHESYRRSRDEFSALRRSEVSGLRPESNNSSNAGAVSRCLFHGGFRVTDLAYWRTAEVMWERCSVWLIAGGLVMAALVLLAAVIDLALGKQKPIWFRALTYAAAMLISLLSVFGRP